MGWLPWRKPFGGEGGRRLPTANGEKKGVRGDRGKMGVHKNTGWMEQNGKTQESGKVGKSFRFTLRLRLILKKSLGTYNT